MFNSNSQMVMLSPSATNNSDAQKLYLNQNNLLEKIFQVYMNLFSSLYRKKIEILVKIFTKI